MATIELLMNEDVKKVLAMVDMREKTEQFRAKNGGGSIEKFAAFIQAERHIGFWSQAKPRLKPRLEWFCRVLDQKDAFHAHFKCVLVLQTKTDSTTSCDFYSFGR